MANNHKFKLDIWGLITLMIMALYLVFLIFPLGMVLYQAVIDKTSNTLTLAYFTKFFSKPYYFSTLMNSFKVGIATTILSVLIGTPLAYVFSMYKIKGKNYYRF